MLDNMTLDKLWIYKGQDAAPEDFLDYWLESLKQIEEHDTSYRLIEKGFHLSFATCYDLFFESIDTSEIYAKVVFPKIIVEPFPVLFLFHGYQGQSPDWSEAFKYVAAGVGVVMMDVRGQSGKSADFSIQRGNTVKGHIVRGLTEGRDSLFYRNVYLDIALLTRVVAQFEQVDKARLMSYGESQGGALAIVAAALNQSIKKVFAVYPFLSDFKRVLALKYDTEAYDELHRYFKFVDPFYQTKDEVFKTLGYIDVKNFASFLKGHTTMVCGLMDDVCPPSTQFAIYNRLKGEKKMHVMPEYGHEAMHVKYPDLVFNWVTEQNIG